jgi:tRNA modification GTPase
VLVCGDEDGALARACALVARETSAPRIAVRTKADLCAVRAWTPPSGLDVAHAVAVSAVTGEGLEALREVLRTVSRTLVSDPTEEHPMVTRARHAQAIELARSEVSAFIEAWTDGALPAPVAATHLRAAVHALDELLGGVDTDEIIGRVFRTFCVGK